MRLADEPFDAAAVARLIVERAAADGRRLPGLGHRRHDPDPRAVFLLELSRELGLYGRHSAVAEAIVAVLREGSGGDPDQGAGPLATETPTPNASPSATATPPPGLTPLPSGETVAGVPVLSLIHI